MGSKVKQIDEYICAEMIKSDIELNYENFYKDDLIRLLKECRKEYKKSQSQLKAKEEAEKEFIKYLEDEIEKLKSEIFINALTSEDIDLYIMRIKLLKNEEILSKFNEILSKGENK